MLSYILGEPALHKQGWHWRAHLCRTTLQAHPTIVLCVTSEGEWQCLLVMPRFAFVWGMQTMSNTCRRHQVMVMQIWTMCSTEMQWRAHGSYSSDGLVDRVRSH